MVNCINEALLLYKLHLPSVHFVDIFYQSVHKAYVKYLARFVKN